MTLTQKIKRVLGYDEEYNRMRERAKLFILAGNHVEAFFIRDIHDRKPKALASGPDASGLWSFTDRGVIDTDGRLKRCLTDAEILELLATGSTEPQDVKPGGVIVLGEHVQADNEALRGYLQDVAATALAASAPVGFGRRLHSSTLSQAVGFCFGHLFCGLESGNSGAQYDEPSQCVELIGVDSNSLRKLAEALRDALAEPEVLVKDNNQQSVFFLQADCENAAAGPEEVLP